MLINNYFRNSVELLICSVTHRMPNYYYNSMAEEERLCQTYHDVLGVRVGATRLVIIVSHFYL